MVVKVCTTSSSSGWKNKVAPPPASSAPRSPFSGIKSKLQEIERAKWARAAPRSGRKQLPHFLPGRTTLFQRTTVLWKVQADRGVRSKTRVLNNEIPKQKGKFIFTRKIPSQRFRELWRLIHPLISEIHDRHKETWKRRERTATNRNLKLKTTCVVWSTSSWRSGPGQGSEAGRWAEGRTSWKKKRAGLLSTVPKLCTGFPGGAVVKNPPAMQEIRVWSLGQEDSPEKGMAIHTSILAWKVPWTEEPSRLQSMGSQRVGHDWATKHTHTHTYTHTHIPKTGHRSSLVDSRSQELLRRC